MTVHDFTVRTADGGEMSLRSFAGQVLLIVNTATKCGLAPQFDGLEKLHQTYKDRGFSVVGFPSNQFANQEPGTDDEVQATCRMRFGVTFPLMAKIDVNGKNEDPLYTFLKQEQGGFLGSAIKWNFTKFLVDGEGNVVKRYDPKKEPHEIAEDIEALLQQPALAAR
jgi:glutathione peroxidase